MQIGLGMNIACVDVLHTQGNLQSTGKMTDCAIQGDGFFILSDGMQQWYTRAGNFNMDENGALVNPSNGLFVRGWMADTIGNINSNTPVANIQLPVGQILSPRATTEIQFGGQLHPKINGILSYSDITVGAAGDTAALHFDVTPDPNNFYVYNVTVTSTTSGAQINGGASWTGTITLDPTTGDVVSIVPAGPTIVVTTPPPTSTNINIDIPVAGQANGGLFNDALNGVASNAVFDPVEPLVNTTRVYDSLGNDHTITTTITKVGINTWNWSAVNELGMPMANSTGVLTFDSTGVLTSGTPPAMTFTPPGANQLSIAPDFSAIRQNASSALAENNVSPYDITSPFQDGYPAGTLESFTIDKMGTIVGVFSNGQNQNLARIAMANFTNPGGLIRTGDTMFQESNNSGPAQVGMAGRNGRGLISPGTVEMSNVDLSEQFTDMIVTERGFQSNSRVITTSDEMLQELLTLKR
jgi:flagellar hook protein FlgE